MGQLAQGNSCRPVEACLRFCILKENSTNLEQFRSISLSVEGKIFISVLSRWMTEFLKNSYIGMTEQTGEIPGAHQSSHSVGPCHEHVGQGSRGRVQRPPDDSAPGLQWLSKQQPWTSHWANSKLGFTNTACVVQLCAGGATNCGVQGKSETPSYHLCPGRVFLEHILSLKSLGEDCYHWCHNQVLKAVAECISKAMTSSKHLHDQRAKRPTPNFASLGL